ncbi:class I SAM-dependent methyltransferase [Streptomyces sp. NPDC091267]|uniref:class I SAM-dependent methyltransferase n=1 Tax=Streptomyces sp. NPDC091267 TaxID=3155195 RepID=UPI0034361B8E
MRDIVNTEQAQAWNGYEGAHWARNQDRWGAVNEGFDQPLLTGAGIGERDRVLDVGCGAGQTARLAARRATSGRVLGVDLSAPMLERARSAAVEESIGNVSFERVDAQVHPFEPAAFDVAISRYGVMFFGDPVGAFANIGRALRPGGRLAFICAADAGENGWVQAMAALRDHLPVGDFGAQGGPGMFSLADPDRIRSVLTSAGFVRVHLRRAEAHGDWGPCAEDAAAFLLDTGPGRHLTDQVTPEARDRAREVLVNHLRAHEERGAVRLRSIAWLVTASRPQGHAAP